MSNPVIANDTSVIASEAQQSMTPYTTLQTTHPSLRAKRGNP